MGFFLTEREASERLSDPKNVLGDARLAGDLDAEPNHNLDKNNSGRSDDVVESVKENKLTGDEDTELDGEVCDTRTVIDKDNRGTPVTASPPIDRQEQDVFSRLKLAKILNGAGSKVGRKTNIRNRTVSENGAVGLSNKLLGARATEQLFGVDPAQQNNLVHGHTGSVDRVQKKDPKQDLLEEIYTQGGEVTKLAFSRLKKALNLLDEEKLDEISDPMKLLATARGFSGIVKDMTPKESEEKEKSVHFHVFVPPQKTLDDYETIPVNRGDYESVEA